MPRKSKADHDLHVVELGLPQYRRAAPPATLSAEESAVWQRTVAACRVDQFPACTHPILVAYCRHSVASERIGRMLSKTAADDPNFKRLARLFDLESRALIACARSLRITPRSRRDPIDRHPEWRRKPWEL